jgi:hypothetical protein
MAGRWRRWSLDLSLETGQRRVLIVLTGLVLLYTATRLWRQPAYIDDPQPAWGDRAGELADRLDPNTAEWTELSALPGIGDKRAQAIVARREFVKRRNPRDVAYRSIRDLYSVTGFGPAMTEQIRPYLVFPATRPATQNEADNPRTPD